MIKALIFDLGNVLLFFDRQKSISQLAHLCEKSVESVIGFLQKDDIALRYERGEFDTDSVLRRLSDFSQKEIPKDQFIRAVSDIFTPNTPMIELIEQMKDQFRLVLLSDTNSAHFTWASAHYPFLKYFHEKVLSYQVGFMKPSPQIYRYAVEKARFPIDQCFYVDDLIGNVEGARRVGLDAIQYTDLDSYVVALKSKI